MEDKSKIIKEFIFSDERPFKSCHASTLVALADGSVLAAWFGGSREGAEDVAIWFSKRIGGRWSFPVKVADEEGIPHWNPVLFQADSGKTFLFYKVGHTIPKWHTRFIISEDGGDTWSQPKPLVEGDIGGRGPVKNKPIKLYDDTWIAPASIEGDYWDAFVDISYDEGKTWIKSSVVPVEHRGTSFKGKGVIQPTLWESEPGIVHMLLRSTDGYIYRSDSKDGGKTWCPAYRTCLPNNNSGIDLVRLDNGTLALVYNPVGQNWGPRTPLVLSTSTDNGQTWRQVCVLEDEEGEYSYPAIIKAGDQIMITYTWKRERIAFWAMPISKL